MINKNTGHINYENVAQTPLTLVLNERRVERAYIEKTQKMSGEAKRLEQGCRVSSLFWHIILRFRRF